MSYVRTVTGDIAPEAFGVTCGHEHLLLQLPPALRDDDPDMCFAITGRAVPNIILRPVLIIFLAASHHRRNGKP